MVPRRRTYTCNHISSLASSPYRPDQAKTSITYDCNHISTSRASSPYRPNQAKKSNAAEYSACIHDLLSTSRWHAALTIAIAPTYTSRRTNPFGSPRGSPHWLCRNTRGCTSKRHHHSTPQSLRVSKPAVAAEIVAEYPCRCRVWTGLDRHQTGRDTSSLCRSRSLLVPVHCIGCIQWCCPNSYRHGKLGIE